MGNLHSVAAGLRRAGASVQVSAHAADLDAAEKVVLPGDGHFGACMREMDARNLRGAVLRAARSKPVLGICIGMQVMYEGSEESGAPGLGLLPGRLIRFPASAGKVPHIGWNIASPCREHSLLRGLPAAARFYFVHSYCAPLGEDDILRARYGAPFAAAVAKGSVVATQFHPEKSASAGAALLKNFVEG